MINGISYVFGAIGFMVGGIAGGYFVGHSCGKEFKKRIESLKAEVDHYREENRRLKKEQLETRERDIEAAEEASKVEEAPESTEPEDKDDGEDDADKIHLISESEYMRDAIFIQPKSYVYYQGDQILTDEADNVIRNQEAAIGREATEEVDDTDEDYLYVRNDDSDELIEITIEHDSEFYRDVMGVY